MVAGATLSSVLIGIDASRVTRPQRTGTENYTLHLLRALLSQDQDNAYRLYLSVPLPPGLLPIKARTSTRLIRMRRLWTQIGLSREMLLDTPDVLFVPSHVLPLVTPACSVVVIYDVGHRFFPRAHRLTEWLYAEWSIRRHVRVAARVLTISRATMDDLVRLYGADPNRIDVAYPAVDARFAPASAAEVARVRSTYGLSRPYVLHLGTIKPRKNVPRLIHAFARAHLPGETQLALGGMTTYGGVEVERAIVETGLADRVRRLSYVPDDDLAALYSGASAVAIPSLYEGFGMPALEALACGAAVVASNRGSLPEIVADAGVIVDPLDLASIAQGLEAVLGSQRLRQALAEAGLRRAADFNWSSSGMVTWQALERAGQSHASMRPRSRAPSASS
jgi:glycosyltransferase involved in cell wall biosynthesis